MKIENYEHLEGKNIDWLDSINGKIINAKVVIVEYDIGITIVNPDNENELLLCQHGPHSNNKNASKIQSDRYDKLFEFSVTCIEEGYYDENEGRKLIEESTFGGSMANCAYNL